MLVMPALTSTHWHGPGVRLPIRRPNMTAAFRFLVIILVVLGVLAVAAGLIYYVEPAKSLPAFFPGYAVHVKGRRTTRGLAGYSAGPVALHVAASCAPSSARLTT